MNLYIGIPEAIYLMLLFAQAVFGIHQELQKYAESKNKISFSSGLTAQAIITFSYLGLLYWGGFFA